MTTRRIARTLITSLIVGAAAPAASAQQPKGDLRKFMDAVQKIEGAAFDKYSGQAFWTVTFRSPGAKDDDLKKLRPLLQSAPEPVGLNLNDGYNVTDAGIAHLENLTILRSVSLGGSRVTDDGLKYLSGLTNLEELYLSGDKFTDAGLAHLAKLTRLRGLAVYSKAVTDAGYKHFAAMTNLEEIHSGDIGHRIGDECLAHMGKLTRLKKLDIGRKKLTDAGMATVKNFTDLRELRLEGPKVTKAGLMNLAPLTRLTQLTLMYCPAANSDALAALKDMTALKDLDIVYCGTITLEASAHLKSLTGLRRLRFEACTDEALEGISALKQLDELDLFYTQIGDAGLKHLSRLTGLKRLNLMNTRITDAGLKYLSGLTGLQQLALSQNHLTGDGLGHLTALKGLKTLWMSECKVTDAGLKSLNGITGLQELTLNGCPVTDAGLAHLKSLKSLRRLDLTGTRVNDEAVIALKREMTKTAIRDIAGDEVTLEKETKRPRPPAEDLSKAEPAFTLTAEQFYKEYEDDRAATQQKYKNKVIELSGTVQTMGHNAQDDTYLMLKTRNEFAGVLCVAADESPWNKVIPGQKVKIKGKFPEMAFSAALVACVVTEVEKSPVITLTADQLAKEYKADRPAAEKKYQDKYLILTGELADRQFNSAGAVSIQLKTEGPVKVTCSFTAFDKSRVKQLKIGQKVTLVGQYTLNFDEAEVRLYFCQVLKKE